MNNIIVYCETDGGRLCDVSLELMTKARDLAAELSCDVEALLIGHNVKGLAAELYAYGAKLVHLADDPRLEYFRTLPYAAITIDLFRREKPQIALFGATSVGRDLAPRVSSALHSGRRQYHSHYRQSRAQAPDGHCTRGRDEKGPSGITCRRQHLGDRRQVHH